MNSMISSCLAVALLVSTATSQDARTAYVLAGQSNIQQWGTADIGNPNVVRPNVMFHSPAGSSTWATERALRTFGDIIGQSDPARHFDIYQIGKSASSVDKANFAWFWAAFHDPATPPELQVLALGLMAGIYWLETPTPPVTPPLPPGLVVDNVDDVAPLLMAAGTADEMKIVWVQGGNDVFASMTTAGYVDSALEVFEKIRKTSRFTGTVDTYLATTGAFNLDASLLALLPDLGTWCDQIRDAFAALVLDPRGPDVPRRLVSHHYDLRLMDEFHHPAADREEFAKRMAEGILDPGIYFDVAGPPAAPSVNGQVVTIPLSQVASVAGAQDAKFFDVRVSGTPGPAAFTVSTAVSDLLVTIASPTLASMDTVTIRHVPGHGGGLIWESNPPVFFRPSGGRADVPLAPFVLQVDVP